MTDITRDLHTLVAIAKLDADIAANRTELGLLPDHAAKIKKAIATIDARAAEATRHLEDMQKERRVIEQAIEDNAEKVKKYRLQLMQVKTNQEYTAMLHEIDHVTEDTDQKEERLLLLMDELEQQEEGNKTFLAKCAAEKAELKVKQDDIEKKIAIAQSSVADLEAEKPVVLKSLDPQLRKRYDRLLAKYGDFAVTNMSSEICQGCRTRIPPQTAVEVRQNTNLITCEGCGRILVSYDG